MSRVSDPALRLQWQRRIRKFQVFHGSVRQFCQLQGVSVASFYQWRAKLTEAPKAPKATNSNIPPAALDSNAPHFVPLQLVQPTTPHAFPNQAAIVLAGGTRIELPCDDSPVLHAVIRSVMHEDAKLRNERREFAVDDAGGIR